MHWNSGSWKIAWVSGFPNAAWEGRVFAKMPKWTGKGHGRFPQRDGLFLTLVHLDGFSNLPFWSLWQLCPLGNTCYCLKQQVLNSSYLSTQAFLHSPSQKVFFQHSCLVTLLCQTLDWAVEVSGWRREGPGLTELTGQGRMHGSSRELRQEVGHAFLSVPVAACVGLLYIVTRSPVVCL